MKYTRHQYINTIFFIIIIFACITYCDDKLPFTSRIFHNISKTSHFMTIAPSVNTSNMSSMNLSEEAKYCSGKCDSLPASCYNCNWTNDCRMGETVKFNCTVKHNEQCTGEVLKIDFQCLYCYLTTPHKEHSCKQNNTTCKVNATPQQRVKGTCITKENVFCLGNRTFTKMMPCSWTSGYSWSTALALSITVGGFGVDRFYLGYWREGLGKFFSFGGLGVWTLVDVVLIGTSYLGPSNGSLYIS